MIEQPNLRVQQCCGNCEFYIEVELNDGYDTLDDANLCKVLFPQDIIPHATRNFDFFIALSKKYLEAGPCNICDLYKKEASL